MTRPKDYGKVPITIWVSPEERDKIDQKAASFRNRSEYIRFAALNAEIKVEVRKSEKG